MTYSDSYRRILNRMGYYAYQNGLIYNHLNQEGGWDGHLAGCRNFIKRAIDHFRPGVVTVLGSGWLLDLPLAEMLENVDKIYLVDIIHPPEVIRQAGVLEKVVLVEKDITGGLIKDIWNAARKSTVFNRLRSLDSVKVGKFVPDFDPGMVISLNILTQLESQLLRWLKGRSRIGDDRMDAFRKQIQQMHVEFLRQHNSVLITDYVEVITRKSGKEDVTRTLLADLPEGIMRDEWVWNFDLTGRENYNSRTIIKVISLAW
jgi:hypothetical protein